MRRRRIVILGGGCGGVAAAWALTRTPELRREHEVTLVQPGWRLGGKGATGRDPARGHAILEHGLHLWLGFYQQAFGMMRDLYESWDAPVEGPQRSLEAAFSPLVDVALAGGPPGRREIWRMRFPELPGRPWDERRRRRDLLAIAATWARRLPEALVDDPDDAWTVDRLAVLTRLSAAVLRGLAVERARHGRALFEHMDELDLREWLRRHGASETDAMAPPIGALYDLGFAYPDGVAGSDRGSAAAGTALKVLLQIFGAYRGAPFWRMNAGMGDTVFAPAYEVLRQRGVRFRFFHRLRHLGLDSSQRRIASIDLDVQAEGADGYEPLVEVGSVRAWPHAPVPDRVGRLAPGDLEADDGAALGSHRLAVGDDFDDVVLAIPATAHHRFASELIEASPRYRVMVESTHGVATVAAQWWMRRSTAQLGWRGAPPVLTGMPGYFRTWADLSPLVAAEPWPERPETLAYFCNVAPAELQHTGDRAEAARRVEEAMREWAVTDLPRIWPAALAPGGRFDEAALLATEAAGPWGTQYARANVADWERYILSLPGTTRHRLAPGESGLSNLWLAGDWTRNAINGGSVEGAVSSGIEAADVLVGRAVG